MKITPFLSSAMFALLAACATAGDFFPLPSTNAIVLNFASEIPNEIEQAIREDFQRCLTPSMAEVELYHFDGDATNVMSLAGFWQPYAETSVITNRFGIYLPEDGIFSNGTFKIDIPYSFATNFQHQIESTAAYSNEIAAAYAFIASLSPTNLLIMSTNQLLSMELWKQVPPGQTAIPQKETAFAIKFNRQMLYFPPPRVAFHVWDSGPTNCPPYLWCRIPTVDYRNHVSHRQMIYFQNQWRFTQWPYYPGEQQW